MAILSGKKTYIVAVLIGAVTAALHLGFIDQGLYNALVGFLGAGGLATLRAGINKL